LARNIDVVTAAALLVVPVDLVAGIASNGVLTLGDAWRAARRSLEAELLAVRADRRSRYMRARRAVQKAARAVVGHDRFRAVVAALAQAVDHVLISLAASLRGLDMRLSERLARIRRSVSDEADRAEKWGAKR